MTVADEISLRHAVAPRSAAQRLGQSTFPAALSVFLAINAIAWTVVPGLIFITPHSSTLEISLWSRDWYLVNYQHPALAGWLLQGAYFLFGDHLWVSFLVSQLCIAGTYLFVFLLGRELLGTERGLFGTLLLPVVSYFNIATVHYNENMVQLPFWAAFCYGLWKATQSGRWSWWLFTAVVAALGVYGKFSMLMVIAFGACWMLLDPAGRRCLRSVPLYLAVGLFILLISPLAVALIETHFGAVKWISSESSGRGVSAGKIAVAEGKTLLIMLAIALVPILISRRRRPGPEPMSQQPVGRPAIPFLLLMGGAPLLLTFAISLFMPVRTEWTSPMYSLAGLLLVAMLPDLRGSDPARRTLLGIAIVISLGAVTSYNAHIYGHRHGSGSAKRDAWPVTAISQRFDRIWHQSIGAPLRIVGGDVWIAGLAGLDSVDRPSLYPDLDLSMWPGGTAARIHRDGVLVLWGPGSEWQPPTALLQRYPHGREMFRWSDNPAAKPIEIDYLIISPVDWSPTI